MANLDFSKMSDDELMSIASQGSQDSTSKFDLSKMSDDELRAIAFQDLNGPKEQPPESFGKRLGRGALASLPMAGSLVGGLVGGTAGLASPMPGGAALGAAGGSGLGAIAGSSLEQVGKSLFFDEKPQSREEHLKELGSQGLAGIAGEMGGQAIGPALNLASSALGGGVSKAKSLAKSFGTQQATTSGEALSKGSISNVISPTTVETSGKLFEKVSPKTLDELRAWVPPENAGKMQSSIRLKEIQSIVPDLEVKPLAYHFNMLDNPKSMKDLKIQFENLPNVDAKKIASYNLSMVDEGKNKIASTLKDINGFEPKHLTDEGVNFIEKIKTQYGAEKDELGPIFEKMQKTRPLTPVDVSDLKLAVINNTKLAPLLQLGPEGEIVLAANTPRTGISRQEYGPIKEVLDDLSGNLTFKEIQNTRDFLRKNIDYTNPRATQEIEKVRSVLLDQLESVASKKVPEMRETFRRYAINEKAKANIEKIIGGQLENIDSMYNANPDKIVNRILSNPNYITTVKQYAGEAPINDMISSYVNTGFNNSLDKVRGFLPHEFRSFLGRNERLISENLGRDQFERLSALADNAYMGKRFLDEINPAGTAASLAAMLEPKTFMSKVSTQGIRSAITSEAASRVSSSLKQRQALSALSEALAPSGASVPGVSSMQKFAESAPGKAPVQKVLIQNALQRRMNQMNQQGGQ